MSELNINFFDPELQACPYDAYKQLRDEQPVYCDPMTEIYHVSRYEDVRTVLLNTGTFGAMRQRPDESNPRQKRINDLWKKGWRPAATLMGRDDPEHKQMRKMFDEAFRPKKIAEIDDFVRDTAYRLIDDFIEQGECEWVHQFAVPFPLTIIVKQMGADEKDLWRIKSWTDAFFRRIGSMLSEEEEVETIEKEIESQHYFQPIFERLRREPDDTLLSELVNREVEGWGRPLNDNELHAEMMGDTFVGGSETTTNALSAGVKLLIENKEVWTQLKSDPEKYLKPFSEEVLRLESPVQMLMRMTSEDVELGGITIPQGAIVSVRYAAANRDDRKFECPEQLDLDRVRPASHLAFGSGKHHCLGAPLARRELWWGFKALVDRVDDLWFDEDKNTFEYHPHIMLRSLKALHIKFRAK